MHMKSSQRMGIKPAAATLCAAVLLCGCSNEIRTGDDKSGGGEGGPATVTLSVVPAAGGQAPASKGLTDAQENAIHDLYILAFQPGGGGEYGLEYHATGKTGGGGNGKYTFTLRRSAPGTADTKLLLVANHNPFPQVSTGMTYAQVQANLSSGELGAAPAFAGTGIPMSGFAGNSTSAALEITEGLELNANLLRAVARVDVGVGTYDETSGTWDKGGVAFQLAEVHVFKPQNRYTLLPLIGNLVYTPAGGTGTPSVTAASPAGTQGGNFTYTGDAITNGTYCKAEIYLPEAALAGGTVYDTGHATRTALVIGGYYNSSPDKSYYRIDFTTAPANTEGDALHDVLRNRLYRYTITAVTNSGYATADQAYEGKKVGLVLTQELEDWVDGVTGEVKPYMYARMEFGGENGTVTDGTEFGPILEKKPGWINNQGKDWAGLIKFDYNEWLGEASATNEYAGLANGGYYATAADAFKREGPHPRLVVAPDNAGSALWKNGDVLSAKKLCRDYRGQGRSDWRLPRLSELCLLWYNRESISRIKGFTPLGTGSEAYWSATERDVGNAWAVRASGNASSSGKESTTCLVRCVRQVDE